MAGEEAAAALFLALAVGGGAIALSHFDARARIAKVKEDSVSWDHMHPNHGAPGGGGVTTYGGKRWYGEGGPDPQGQTPDQHHINLARRSELNNLRQEMSAAKNHETTQYDYETGVYVGHPLGLESVSEHQAGKQRVVPAYKMRRGRRTVLPAMIENNHESNYFYNQGGPAGVGPNYDWPKYHMYSENSESDQWVTMEDLARAIEALNGKVEEYKNIIYKDMSKIHFGQGA